MRKNGRLLGFLMVCLMVIGMLIPGGVYAAENTTWVRTEYEEIKKGDKVLVYYKSKRKFMNQNINRKEIDGAKFSDDESSLTANPDEEEFVFTSNGEKLMSSTKNDIKYEEYYRYYVKDLGETEPDPEPEPTPDDDGNKPVIQDSYEIKINDKKDDSYTYAAYQIFSGTLAEAEEDNKFILSDIKWGEGIDKNKETELIKEIKNLTGFKDCKDAKDVAKKLEEINNNSKEADDFAAIIGKYLSGTNAESKGEGEEKAITVKKPGYYLVKSMGVPENGVYSKYMLRVVADTSVTHKGEVPTVDKDISKDEEGKIKRDYNIGDEIPFTITAKINNFDDQYKKYYLKFEDTMSEGLTYVKDSAKIMIGEEDVTKKFEINCIENILTAECKDLKAIDNVKLTKDTEVVLKYKAKLNEKAVIGKGKDDEDGNENSVKIEYSNNPYSDGKATDKTPEDKTNVYTYGIKIEKTDSDKNALSGADFELYTNKDCTEESKVKAIKEYSEDGKTWYAENAENAKKDVAYFRFKGLASGTYYIKETKTPAGYNTIEPLEIKVAAEYDGKELKELTPSDGFDIDNNSYYKTNIINNKGSLLPETGGRGTTLIYIIGAIMVLGSVVVMLRKKE